MTRAVVYRNLQPHKATWSVADVQGARGRGRVQDVVDAIVLRNVTLVVYESASRSVRRKLETQGKRDRNVHAWAVGEVVEGAAPPCGEPVSYSPYRGVTFTLADGTPITQADTIIFAADGKAYLPCG